MGELASVTVTEIGPNSLFGTLSEQPAEMQKQHAVAMAMGA